MHSLTSVEGLCVLGSIMRSTHHASAGMSLPLLAAAPISWGRFLKLMPAVPAFFSEVEREAMEAEGGRSVKGQSGFAAQLAKLSDKERTEQVQTYLSGIVGDVVGREVGGDEPLLDAGLDSLGAVELHSTVQQTMGVELPSTLVFDYPNINAVAGFISDTLAPEGEVEEMMQDQSLSQGLPGGKILDDVMIYVSSVSSRAPGRMRTSIEETCGLDCSSVYERADSESIAWRAGPVGSYFGGLMCEVEMFDSESLRMSQGEALVMDPQQRLLLQGAWEALTSNTSRSSPVGVFVGISSMDYSKVMSHYLTEASPYAGTGNALSVAAGRVSYVYGLQGPAISTDTACSSSLVGSHIACDSIILRECTMSLACGVNLTLAPDTGVVFKQAGMLSLEGRCKTLDADADGYVRGEACGVLLLDGEGKSIDRDGPVICFAGSAVNQDGRSSALTAPNGPAQQRVISSALQRATLTSFSVAILNMHGTGTPLGDPIEIGAAHAVLMHSRTTSGSSDTEHVAPLSVQAGKTYVGHTEPAAGVVGLIHAIHGTCHRRTSPVLHLRHVNPHLTRILGGSQQSRQIARLGHMCREQNGLTWSDSNSMSTHASGVSAFAFQGTNAHALVRHTMVNVGVLSSWAGQHWRNQRFWVGPLSHPLVVSALPVLHDDIHVCMYSQLLRPSMQWIWDHRVMGRVLFPGAGFMETASALVSVTHQGSLPGAAVNASITAPLMLSALTDDTTSAPPVYLESKVWCLTGDLHIGSTSTPGQGGSSVHMRSLTCRLVSEVDDAEGVSDTGVSIDCIRSQCQGPVDWCEVHKLLSSGGLQYGPQFSGAWNVRVNSGRAAQGCMKSIPNALPSDHNETGLMVHPAALDGCLQLAFVMHVGADMSDSSGMSEGSYVPAGFGAFSVPQKTHDLHMYALAESVVSPSATTGSVISNHVLQVTSGVPVAV